MRKTRSAADVIAPSAKGEPIVITLPEELPQWIDNQKTWPRYDPVRDMYLCESCWNDGNWKHHCARGFCECCRCNGELPKKVKFTGEGQTSIDMSDCITITAKSLTSSRKSEMTEEVNPNRRKKGNDEASASGNGQEGGTCS